MGTSSPVGTPIWGKRSSGKGAPPLEASSLEGASSWGGGTASLGDVCNGSGGFDAPEEVRAF